MNQLTTPETNERQVQLKELSQKHKMVAALLAQGRSRLQIAEAVELAPEYITWLGGDKLFKDYVREMSRLADTQMEALYSRSVDVVAEALDSGNNEDRLKAARLTMEATGRLGKGGRSTDEDTGEDRLELLAENLLKLQRKHRERTINGEARVVSEEEAKTQAVQST